MPFCLSSKLLMFASNSQPPFLYLCESTSQHDLITTLLCSGRKNRSNHRCPSHSHQQDYTTFLYTLLSNQKSTHFTPMPLPMFPPPLYPPCQVPSFTIQKPSYPTQLYNNFIFIFLSLATSQE